MAKVYYEYDKIVSLMGIKVSLQKIKTLLLKLRKHKFNGDGDF